MKFPGPHSHCSSLYSLYVVIKLWNTSLGRVSPKRPYQHWVKQKDYFASFEDDTTKYVSLNNVHLFLQQSDVFESLLNFGLLQV